MKSFEEYLRDECYELHSHILDEDKPHVYLYWLGNQDTESLLIYAESWGRHIKNTILQEVTNLTK